MDVSGHDGNLMSADGFERTINGTFLQYFLRTFIHPQTTDFKQGKNLFFFLVTKTSIGVTVGIKTDNIATRKNQGGTILKTSSQGNT